MATQTLIEQHVIFISTAQSLDVNAILQHTIIKQLAANCFGNTILGQFQLTAYKWDGTNILTGEACYDIKCLVTPAFQATIQANLANLRAAFPTLTVITYGQTVTYGA